MITLKAMLINSAQRKARITCYRCDLSYTARNYDILYGSEKLAYFKFKPIAFKRSKTFCHDCMHKECIKMLRISDHKKIKLIMNTNGEEIICTFEK